MDSSLTMTNISEEDAVLHYKGTARNMVDRTGQVSREELERELDDN